MMLTPPLALKVHEPYIRHEIGESAFTRAFILIQALVCQNASLMSVLKFKTSSITSARLGDWGLIQIFVREGLESMILKQIDVK